ncbi:hypothetical protein [Microcystis phage Mvi-JY20]|uniref:Uncharacterized protein n=1 Tax=Microcystis phage Mvi-JY20 TaxID=3128146 RepID=A0AAX4QIP4_9CAUD
MRIRRSQKEPKKMLETGLSLETDVVREERIGRLLQQEMERQVLAGKKRLENRPAQNLEIQRQR